MKDHVLIHCQAMNPLLLRSGRSTFSENMRKYVIMIRDTPVYHQIQEGGNSRKHSANKESISEMRMGLADNESIAVIQPPAEVQFKA